MDWVSLLGQFSIWIILLPLFIGLILYRILITESKLVLLIVLIGTIPQVLRPFMENTTTLTVLYNLYTPLEFFLYLFIFKRHCSSEANKIKFTISVSVFILASVLFIFKHGIEQRFLNEWVIVNNTIQVFWVCLCVMEYYKNDSTNMDSSMPFFWYIIGIAIYGTCTVIFYSLWYLIKANTGNDIEMLKAIHHTFNIVLYLFFSIGLIKNYLISKKQKQRKI